MGPGPLPDPSCGCGEGEIMKLRGTLLGLITLALVLWFTGVLAGEIALLIMSVGVGLLFAFSEEETRS
jgi:hypothetical protein